MGETRWPCDGAQGFLLDRPVQAKELGGLVGRPVQAKALVGLPVDKVKIDRSFIARLGQETGADTIVRAIVALGHGLGLHVTAEGVENESQLRFLRLLLVRSGTRAERTAPTEKAAET